MKDLRTLLIDCRIELRKLVRDFQKTELCERLDHAISALNFNPVEIPAPKPAPAPEPAAERNTTSNQVALAWQQVARDLKFDNPQLYDQMQQKVMGKLGVKTLVDQVTEIRQLEEALAEHKAALTAAEKDQMKIANQRDDLLGALAMAVPQLSDGGDPLGVALARIEFLKANGARPMAGGGNGAAPRAPDPESHIPTVDILKAVAEGARQFTKEQREFSVGEAMVVLSFAYTPVELLEKGDAFLAQSLLDARNK